jgi:hypothetical protein
MEVPAGIVLLPSALLIPELLEGTTTVKVFPGVRVVATFGVRVALLLAVL